MPQQKTHWTQQLVLMTLSIIGKLVILALLSSMVLLGLNPGYFLYLATSNPYKLAIWQENTEGGTCCLQQWCHPKKQLCSIVPASYETTMCCCGEKILHLGCFQTLHPQSQQFMGVYIPKPPNVPTKRDVPNSFILVAWLRQIVYDKNASRVPVLNRWMMAAIKIQPKSVLSRSASCTCPFCFCGLVRIGRAETNGWHNGCGKEP